MEISAPGDFTSVPRGSLENLGLGEKFWEKFWEKKRQASKLAVTASLCYSPPPPGDPLPTFLQLFPYVAKLLHELVCGLLLPILAWPGSNRSAFRVNTPQMKLAIAAALYCCSVTAFILMPPPQAGTSFVVAVHSAAPRVVPVP